MTGTFAPPARGSSFAWPLRLLGPRSASRLGGLYALCRALDDLADADGRPEAFARLARIRDEVVAGRPSDPLARLAADLLAPGPGRAAFCDLVTGLLSDRGIVALPDEAALRTYCYRVAGTVGVMACAALDVRLESRDRRRAVALGCAMQMTNIARDVAEDAAAGRRYLPATWLPLSPGEIARPGRPERHAIAVATGRLIRLSEPLYEQGRRGLPALPPRLRFAVRAAAGAYREIGHVLMARGCDPCLPRAVVPAPARLRAALMWSAPHPVIREAADAARR